MRPHCRQPPSSHCEQAPRHHGVHEQQDHQVEDYNAEELEPRVVASQQSQERRDEHEQPEFGPANVVRAGEVAAATKAVDGNDGAKPKRKTSNEHPDLSPAFKVAKRQEQLGEEHERKKPDSTCPNIFRGSEVVDEVRYADAHEPVLGCIEQLVRVGLFHSQTAPRMSM